MVVKLAAEVGQTLSVVPLGGLCPRDAAEELVKKARLAEPDSVFVIQEVGSA